MARIHHHHRQHLKLACAAFVSAQLVDTEMQFPSYSKIRLTVTIITCCLPSAFYCTSLKIRATLSAKIHRGGGGGRGGLEEEKTKVADFNKSALATQLEMMQSLQPNTL